MWYEVETGNFKRRQWASGREQAAVLAFKQRAPSKPSILTRVRPWSKSKGKHGCDVWTYQSSLVLLRKAGYKVSELQVP